MCGLNVAITIQTVNKLVYYLAANGSRVRLRSNCHRRHINIFSTIYSITFNTDSVIDGLVVDSCNARQGKVDIRQVPGLHTPDDTEMTAKENVFICAGRN